jgi:aldehyde dehydrogenase (NAD+)
LRDIGDRIAEDADRLARIEVQDNGKLLSEMRGQVDCVPQWFYYYGGLADKIEGTVLPSTRRATSPTPGASPSGSSPSSPRGIRR